MAEKKEKNLEELLKGPNTGINSVFSVNSPVDQLEAEKAPDPKPLGYETFKKLSARILNKLGPLLHAREAADKVYSNGYFQRHYPGAEKKIKTLLDDHVMNAWSHSLGEDDNDKPKKELGNGVTIHISIGK